MTLRPVGKYQPALSRATSASFAIPDSGAWIRGGGSGEIPNPSRSGSGLISHSRIRRGGMKGVTPGPANRGSKGGALLDATTFVRANQLVHDGLMGPTTLFALANLIDGLLLYDELNTLSPCESDEPMFNEVLDDLGLSPTLLTVPAGKDGEMEAVVRAENKGCDLQFALIRFDEDGHETLPAACADVAAATPFQQEIEESHNHGSADGSPTLEQRLNWEGKTRFRSMHCYLLTTD